MQSRSINSTKYLQQRKFFVVLPILIFPFLTFLLWSIGLIGVIKIQGQTIAKEGFNSNLPGALPSKDSSWNKLKFYEEADKDSAKYKTLQRNDPNYSLPLFPRPEHPSFDTTVFRKQSENGSISSYDPYPAGLQTNKDPNEEKVYQKLSQLTEELNKTKQGPYLKVKDTIANNIQGSPSEANSTDLNLENLMQKVQGSDNGSDPEMQQINGMLEKILDIQHPDRVTNKIKQESEMHKQQVFAVTRNNNSQPISLLQRKQIDSSKEMQSLQNSFYPMDEGLLNQTEEQNAIAAIIPETQTLVTGATVKLQLANEVYINGMLIPKNEFIYGIASLEGERLTISIKAIKYQNNILPVSLAVYDIDGLNGIYVPGAISRDVAKQSTEQAIQGIGLASLDPSIGAQAASAGIQAAKSLIGKKVKQVKVRVKAGYQVLLQGENQKDK